MRFFQSAAGICWLPFVVMWPVLIVVVGICYPSIYVAVTADKSTKKKESIAAGWKQLTNEPWAVPAVWITDLEPTLKDSLNQTFFIFQMDFVLFKPLNRDSMKTYSNYRLNEMKLKNLGSYRIPTLTWHHNILQNHLKLFSFPMKIIFGNINNIMNYL